MAEVLNASSLTLREVYERFPLEEHVQPDLGAYLDLEPLPDIGASRLELIRQSWRRSLFQGLLNEGCVKFLTVSPLLMEAGYLGSSDVRTLLEEKIAEIAIESDDRVIRGRMDVLVLQNPSDRPSLCVLIIEAKNSTVNVLEGLPQLLVYIHTFLDKQKSVWGLLTTGTDYTFVRLQQGSYQLFKGLNLLFPDDSKILLQALIAIRKLQPEPVVD
ncbi:MAG: restriction endonuclease subunit R [Cyanophyceae cyanobacterium]